MKKVLALILATMMILAVASCGPKKPVETTGENDTTPAVTTPEATTPEETTTAGKPETPVVNDALDLLNKVWATWDEEMMFPAMGGDFSEENMTPDAPGKYSLAQENIAEILDSTFGVPQDSASLIVDAASLTHMMNANTFTCGAFRLKNASDVDSFASALKENVVNRNWMCGFPDTLIIISVGDYVISAFGHEELIETFKTKTLAAIDGAKVLYEESLAF